MRQFSLLPHFISHVLGASFLSKVFIMYNACNWLIAFKQIEPVGEIQMYNGLKHLWEGREKETDWSTSSLYSSSLRPVASGSRGKSPCFGIWREESAKACLQLLLLVGLSSRQLYGLPHGKAFRCDSKTKSLLKGQHRSHTPPHAKRKKKKSAEYHTRHHFIRLRWKLASSFLTVPVEKEGLVDRATSLF